MTATARRVLPGLLLLAAGWAQERPAAAAAPAPPPPPTRLPRASLQDYVESIPGTEVRFEMVALEGGAFRMGSPDAEPGHAADEGPVHDVVLAPFWIGRHEVTWDEYELWAYKLDRSPNPPAVDAVARPTPPYCDMTFGMGRDRCPAICMTQHAARTYCQWLSAKTGRAYRLPTEAEWEYACRAGASTAYSFGDDPALLDDYAWSVANGREEYHPVGLKKANAFGLHDMHGNVAEWVLDQHLADFYAQCAARGAVAAPLAEPTRDYPQVVRGGSFEDAAPGLRSAARRGSHPSWKEQDPQIPKSKWYHTDAQFVGFRVVREHDGQGAQDGQDGKDGGR